MKIIILGGTGRVGSHIVKYALQDGHHVTVLARHPENVQLNDERLTVIQGDALDEEAIAQAMNGMDVVISALNTDGGTTLSESMPLILTAMKAEGIRRIITIGTAGILQSRVAPDVLRYRSSESRRKTTRAAEEHEKVYHILSQSDFDWTIVCPTYLPDGERLGTYRTETDFLPEGGSRISVPDTAEFAYSLIESGEHIKKRVGIAY
ncbi:NAD(P)-dependent oxidoreductase [Bhargavaea beijingensis]|uniref:Putative NADH-flavin reductase n=1 Tax=Bhargavaea beijingensis TaxID=426756 RepID=A0A1G6XXI9_9BACL|nr:SDR family oxidoreductase [Bhargavaea beijingensis]RSK25134.1 SDR family oxidoreductase [Bhargavaea beijingensis]SDD82393.1 Putative NADH-flavin reductase [Bhargavaea beijingensis]